MRASRWQGLYHRVWIAFSIDKESFGLVLLHNSSAIEISPQHSAQAPSLSFFGELYAGQL
jgi:hypothetical protein